MAQQQGESMRKTMKRTAAATAVLLAASLTAGACSSSKSKGGTGTTPTKSIPKSASADINPKDPATLVKGGTLTLAVTQYSTQWNQNQVDGNEFDTKHVDDALMPHAFHFDATGTPILNTDYLVSAEVTASSPKQVTTYKLNPKAKWSDGTAITAADYIAQWGALNGTNDKFNAVGTTGYDSMESVVAGADDHTVVVTYKTPFAEWKSLFDPLFPAAANKDPDSFDNYYKEKIPLTAGPFKLDKLDDATKTITVVKDPAWWGTPAVLDKIIFRDMTTAAQGDAYNNKEIDAFDIGPSAALFEKVKGTANSTIHYAGAPNFRHITINTQSKVLGDVAVRKALFEAIDRTAIADTDMKNLGTWQPKTMDNHFYVNNQAGYVDNVSAIAKFDVEQSKKDLTAAGWVPGADGIRAKDGQKLSIKWVEPEGTKTTANEAALLKVMFKAVGAELVETPVNSDDYFDKYITPGQFDMTAYSYIGTAFPVSGSIDLYRSVTDQTKTHGNSRRDGNAEIDKLLAAAGSELDPAKAIAAANTADKAIWAEFGLFTLYQRPNIVITKSTLANFGAFGFQDVDYTKVGFTS